MFVVTALFYQGTQLISSCITDSVLLRIGALGFLAGVLCWLVWLGDFLFRWVAHMGGGVFPYYEIYPVFFALFSVSYALSSCGFFGFKKKYGSNVALGCGIFYIIIAVALGYSIIDLRFFLRTGYLLMVSGQLLWGLMLLSLRRSFPNSIAYVAVGILFVLMGVFGVMWWPVFAYWGLGFWFAFLGWLYAINAGATAVLLFRLTRPAMLMSEEAKRVKGARVGFYMSLIAGLMDVFFGLVVRHSFTPFLLLLGILVIIGAALILKSGHEIVGGILVVCCSIIYWLLSGIPPSGIGLLLGVLGGGLGIAKK